MLAWPTDDDRRLDDEARSCSRVTTPRRLDVTMTWSSYSCSCSCPCPCPSSSSSCCCFLRGVGVSVAAAAWLWLLWRCLCRVVVDVVPWKDVSRSRRLAPCYVLFLFRRSYRVHARHSASHCVCAALLGKLSSDLLAHTTFRKACEAHNKPNHKGKSCGVARLLFFCPVSFCARLAAEPWTV